MAEFPAMPLWTDAYLADTRHLSTTEHGAYLLLLVIHWRIGEEGLPDDDKLLARYAGLTVDKWRRLAPTVRAFFINREGRLVQARLLDELQHLKRQKEKSARGGEAKALKYKERGSAKALPKSCLKPAPIPTPNTLGKPNGAKAPSNPENDPVKALFDLGVSLLVESGSGDKQARSLIGKWRKVKTDAEVLQGILDCKARAISEPVEWLEKRFNGAKFVSPSGFEYRGSLEAIRKQAEKRSDFGTFWTVDKQIKEAAVK